MSEIPRRRPELRRGADRILGGVCSGLATHFGLEPLVVRVIFLALALLNGAGVLVYVLLWILMPDAEVPAGEVRPAAHPSSRAAWFGAILIVLGLSALASNLGWFSWWTWSLAGPIVLIGVGLVLLLRRI